MTMPGRKYTATGESYRYSINGQERDKELNENITTALYWEYDSRIGRRWNVDPVPKTMVSNYVVLGNNPLMYVDPLGNDWYKKKGAKNDDGLVWFKGSRKRKGYERDERGKNFWTDWNQNGVSTWYGSSKDDIMLSHWDGSVTVYARTKQPKKYFYNVFNLPSSTEAERKQWKIDQHNFYIGNYAAVPAHKMEMYQRWKQADEEWHDLSLGFLAAGAAPLAIMAAVESGAGYYLFVGGRTTWQARSAIAGFDASYQLINTGTWNPIQTIGSQFGPLTAGLSSQTQFDWKTFRPSISPNASLKNIIISTAANALGSKITGTFEKTHGAAAAGGVMGQLPGIWGDGIITATNNNK